MGQLKVLKLRKTLMGLLVDLDLSCLKLNATVNTSGPATMDPASQGVPVPPPHAVRPLPPVNAASPLLATGKRPCEDSGLSQPESQLPPPAFTFDTSELQLALTRSRQQTGSGGGLRRATSAPHSMDTFGQEPSSGGGGGSSYLTPSGGPMRRISSSLGMRRSSSFFWTPAAHHDFERAVATLTARGADCSAANIHTEMAARADLQLSDVDKHLRKRSLVQRGVLQSLIDRPPLQAAADNAAAASHAPNATANAAPASTNPFAARAGGGLHSSPSSMRPSMAAVAEEEPVSAAAVAAAAALSEGLAHQFSTQKLQHMQLAAAREALLTHTERQIIAGQMQ